MPLILTAIIHCSHTLYSNEIIRSLPSEDKNRFRMTRSEQLSTTGPFALVELILSVSSALFSNVMPHWRIISRWTRADILKMNQYLCLICSWYATGSPRRPYGVNGKHRLCSFQKICPHPVVWITRLLSCWTNNKVELAKMQFQCLASKHRWKVISF